MENSKKFELLKKALYLYIAWRIALLLITAFGLNNIPHITQPGWTLNKMDAGVTYWNRWANWDGGHYIAIADLGYRAVQTVFFPLYPLLIFIVSLTGLDSFWSGFLISQIATVLLIYFFYKLLRLDFNQNKSELIVLLLLAFPTSFYFGAVYTESLFLALAVSALYFARVKNWPLAALLAGLAMITRMVGVAVFAAVIVEYFFGNYRPQIMHAFRSRIARIGLYLVIFNLIIYESLNLNIMATSIYGGVLHTVYEIIILLLIAISIVLAGMFIYQKNIQLSLYKRIITKPVFYFALGLLPFLGYLLFLHIQFGDSLSFIHHEANWNKKLTSPLQMIVDIIQAFYNSNFFIATIWNQGTFERMFSMLLVGGVIWSFFKLRFSYIIYFLFVTLIPLSSGIVVDMTRYALAAFPLLILIGDLNNRYIIAGWLFFSTCLLGLLSIMYINAYWVI